MKISSLVIIGCLLFFTFMISLCESMIVPILMPTILVPSDELSDLLSAHSSFVHQACYVAILAMFPILMFFCAPVIGGLTEFYGRQKVILCSLFLTAVALLIQGFSMHVFLIEILMFGRLMNGVVAGIDGTLQDCVLTKVPEKKSSAFLGYTLLAAFVGYALGSPFALFVIHYEKKIDASEYLGWGEPFYLCSIISFVIFFILFLAFKRSPESFERRQNAKVDFLKGLRDVAGAFRSDKRIRNVSIAFVLAMMTLGCYETFLPIYLTQMNKIPEESVAWFMSYFTVATLAPLLWFGTFLLRRVGCHKAFTFFLVVGLILLALHYVISDFSVIRAFILLLGFFLGFIYFTLYDIYANLVDESRRAWILSVADSLWGLSMGLGTLLCGVIAMIGDIYVVAVCMAMFAMALFFEVFYCSKYEVDKRSE